MNRYVDVTRSDLPREIQALVDEDELKESVLSEVEAQAMHRASKEVESSIASIQEYRGVSLSGDSRDEYMMVLEFLETSEI